MQKFTSKIKIFHRNEDGIATVWAMFWLIICFALSGLAIDTANAWKIKQILQSTADASSVSAAMEFYFTDSDPNHPLENVKNRPFKERVKIVANMYAEANMHVARYGDVLPDESIILGHWDGDTFTPDTDDDAIFPNAVRVITEQVDKFSLGTFFLRFIGIYDFDIRASSVSAADLPVCDAAAILSYRNVMIEGNNSFNDFCIYGEEGVDSQAQNVFGYGTYVGMDDINDCGSGNSAKAHCDLTDTNPSTSEGFGAALRAGLVDTTPPASLGYKMLASDHLFKGVMAYDSDSDSLEDALPDLINTYLYESMHGPFEGELKIDSLSVDQLEALKVYSQTDYLGKTISGVDLGDDKVVAVKMELILAAAGGKGSITIMDVIPAPVYGTIYVVDCTQLKGKLNMGGSSSQRTISEIAVIGLDCEYDFDSSIAYDSAFIMTTSDAGFRNSGSASISSSSGATFGNIEGSCTIDNTIDNPLDKLTLLTPGSMKFAGHLEGSNFDFVAAGAVNFASGGSPQEPKPHVGSSITAGGDVHIAAHHTFDGCRWSEGLIPGNMKYLVSIVQ